MTTDPGTAGPGAEPSVSIIDTVWGTVVGTRDVVGLAAAVKLRRIALRRLDVVVLDLRATSIAESTVRAAIADLATGLQERGGVLRIVRSPRTPDALVASVDAPVYASLAEALGFRPPSDLRSVDPPDRPSGRDPPTTGGRGGMGPERSPAPGDPGRTHPAPLEVPHARRPEVG